MAVALVALLIIGESRSRPVAQASPSSQSDAAAPSSRPTEFLSSDTATATAMGSTQTSQPTVFSPTSQPTPYTTPVPVACVPTDQDHYVYHPYRLKVAAACIRVTGIVQAVRQEADGDFHILLALDATYASLLTPANQGVELGDLVVEPICVHPVTQADAVALCAADPDRLPRPYPIVGDRVWMEGRYVFDLDHGGWAELHPLYRWGLR